MTTTNFYNIALVPESKSLVTSCQSLAAANFGEQASEYILGLDANAHVTLCQFKAREQDLAALYTALKPVTLSLRFSSLYIRPGVKIHQGKYWVGLSVRPEAALLDLQRQMSALVAKFALDCLTDGANYLPHLTFARIHVDRPIALTVLPGDDLFAQAFEFKLTVGQSNQLGVYSKQLWPGDHCSYWH